MVQLRRMLGFVISRLSVCNCGEQQYCTTYWERWYHCKGPKEVLVTKLITVLVENRILKLLPKKLALAFDGRSAHLDHCFAVLAPLFAECKKDCETKLLAFSTLDDATTQNSDNHLEFFDFVLEYIGKGIKNISAFTADNCSYDRLIVQKCKKPLLGCGSHHFNIALVNFLSK